MGVEYNHLGEECESRKESQRVKICMGWNNNLRDTKFFCMRESREQERDIEVMCPWRVNSRARWSVIGANWIWKTEEIGFHA